MEAEAIILKQSSEQRERQFSELLRCLKMWECLSEESVGFTNITGATACTRKPINDLQGSQLSSTLGGIGGEVIVKKFSNNILIDITREQIPP